MPKGHYISPYFTVTNSAYGEPGLLRVEVLAIEVFTTLAVLYNFGAATVFFKEKLHPLIVGDIS